MENRYVEIKNATRGELLYRLPSLNVRRSLLPGMTMKVSFDEMREALCDYGVRTMFRLGYLRCVNDKDAIDLDIKEETKDIRTILYVKAFSDCDNLTEEDIDEI